MSGNAELRVSCVTRPSSARILRHALAAFLKTLAIEPDWADDILTAVGEALANAIEHAYGGQASGEVELRAQLEASGTLIVSVSDRGRFVERAPRPGRGFGLRIARAIARTVTLDTTNGTQIRMVFESDPDSNSVVC